jgi:hypothetical protein
MRHLIAFALGGLLAGCMGDVGDTGQGGDDTTNPPPGGGMAKSLYTANVHSILNRCSGGACHSSDASSAALGHFYIMDAEAGYNKITQSPTIIGSGNQAFSSIAPIITKIEAGHQGVTYTPAEKTSITGWLAKEVDERKNSMPNTPPPPDPKEVLRTFSGCLTLADFNTAQMAQKWSTMAAQNNQKCLNCHQGGIAGFVVSTDPALYFQLVTEQSAQMLKYFSVDTSVTPAKVIINTGSFMNAGVTLAGHPRFDPTTNQGMTALKAWYDLAAAKGTCGAPTLKD